MRLFEEHKNRKTFLLDGVWNANIQSKEYSMPVPGCWEANPELANYRGKGIYKKILELEQDCNLRLVFKGVSHTADVFFDGVKVVHHYNEFTPFDAVIKNVKCGSHELLVMVDNSFSEDSALHKANDYYSYGGITRSVGVEYLDDIYIKNIRFIPKYDNGWEAEIIATIENLSDEDIVFDLSLKVAEKLSVTHANLIKANEIAEIKISETYENITQWSCDDPKLYTITAELLVSDEIVDDKIDRIGFREISIKENKILLNGKEIFLKGFNRHEDYAGVGCAIPLELMMNDIWLIKDLGANAIRTSHYPNDEKFLDLCDENGIMLWEENHARGLYLDDMLNPNFEKQCEDCITEMIENHINHPSIIIWGLLNECASETEEGREMYKKQYAQVRSLDTSRPVTSASCRYYNDICLDLPDIVSYNIYSGWYNSDPVKDTLDEEFEYINANNGKGKPFIMSEFGAAAMYGFRDVGRRKWSEERQADILEETLDVYMHDERISGVFIWQFCDCRVTEEGDWFMSRVCMRNNKGVVDRYRRPKMAYEVVKRKFSEK